MAESQRTEPHALSDSEKKKKLPRKTKSAAHITDSPGNSGHAHSLPVPVTMPTLKPTGHSQVNNEPAEMRAMFKEMKALTEEFILYGEIC